MLRIQKAFLFILGCGCYYREVETGTTSKIFPEKGASKASLKRLDRIMAEVIRKYHPERKLLPGFFKKY